MLVLRCYGFCTVLNSPRWLVSVGVKARVQRTGLLVVRESDRREKQERAGEQERTREDAPRLLNCPVLDPPTGGWSNPSVRMGRNPAHVHGFWGHAHVI